MNELTDVIAEFELEAKAGIPKIIELLTDSSSAVQCMAVYTIQNLGQRGK
jgi:hypothetical protein